MKVYIASSWSNQHAVEMLTSLLREKKIEVISFVDEAVEAEGRCLKGKFDIDKWIDSPDGHKKFIFDTRGAIKSDLVIYIGPSGIDAWAEVGAAWSAGVLVIGLYAKGEKSGLMRRMVEWFDSYHQIIDRVCQERDVMTTRRLINEVVNESS